MMMMIIIIIIICALTLPINQIHVSIIKLYKPEYNFEKVNENVAF
jgi:hypothetical protein